MYTPIFLLLWYVGGHYMDVKVFGQIGGWGSKKKVFGYVDVIISKITFHFNAYDRCLALYIDYVPIINSYRK